MDVPRVDAQRGRRAAAPVNTARVPTSPHPSRRTGRTGRGRKVTTSAGRMHTSCPKNPGKGPALHRSAVPTRPNGAGTIPIPVGRRWTLRRHHAFSAATPRQTMKPYNRGMPDRIASRLATPPRGDRATKRNHRESESNPSRQGNRGQIPAGHDLGRSLNSDHTLSSAPGGEKLPEKAR